jgi:carnitine-CoA ligase
VTPGQLLKLRAGEDSSQVFALCAGGKITLGELDLKSDRLANSLVELGIKKGQKIAIISHSNIEYLICEYGILKAGAVCVPVNCLLKADDLSYLLENSDTVFAFVHSSYIGEFPSYAKESNSMRYCIMDDKIRDGNGFTLAALLQMGARITPHALPELSDGDTCCILYTSGTTGRSKGVVYENYAMVPWNGESYVQQMMDVIKLGPEDTTYLPFPLYHVLGQVHLIGALRNGGKIALAEKFSVSRFWSEAVEFGATVLVHQGASIPLLLKQPISSQDKKHKVRISVGAGVSSEDAWRKFQERFGVKVLEHYAQTEGALFGAGTMPTSNIGTVGKPFPTAEIRLVDENYKDARESEPGQLISKLKSPNARKKPSELYYKDPEKGESRFTEDGWFKAGDVMKLDAEGYLHYVGKVETFIRYRGENISPLQIESVVSKHPLVDECIAVAIPNQEFGGDDIKVVVALSSQDSALTAQELVSWCEKMLPKFMIPRYVEFVPELKKTEQTKKIARNEYSKNSSNTWDRLGH